MALPAWPATVPYASERDAWGLQQPFRPPEETEFEQGPERSRPSPDTGPAVLSFSLSMTTAQFDVFRTFVRDTLFKGSSRFTMPIRYPDGSDVTRTVKIAKGVYTASSEGFDRARVSFTLNVWSW